MEMSVLELRTWWSEAYPLLKGALPNGIQLQCEITEGDCCVAIGKSALTQAVFNLVQNAGDAMKSRGWGTVTVWARTNTDRTSDAPQVDVGVRDDGPGMSPGIREQCIEPYFTTKDRGVSSGFGLSLVYGLVTNAGGTVAIDSELGRGTSVTLGLRREERPRRTRQALGS